MTILPPSLEVLEQVRQWRNGAMEALRTPFMLTQEQQQEYYKDLCDRHSRVRMWCFSEDGVVFGFGGIENIEWENGRGEISMILDPVYRQAGWGRKILGEILHKAFNELRLETIIAECYLCNSAREFWEKRAVEYGARTTILPRTKYWNGTYYDSLVVTFVK